MRERGVQTLAHLVLKKMQGHRPVAGEHARGWAKEFLTAVQRKSVKVRRQVGDQLNAFK